MIEIVKWQVMESNLVLDERWARVRRDVCLLPDGRVVDDYYYWEGGDYAQVFALTTAQEVVLTRQYKHGVKEIVIELPAGEVEVEDVSPLETAKRELQEETGFTHGDWVSLGTLNVSSAKATTRAYSFLAQAVTNVVNPSPDQNEVIDVFLMPIDAVIDMVMAGEIKDVGSISTCFRALRTLRHI